MFAVDSHGHTQRWNENPAVMDCKRYPCTFLGHLLQLGNATLGFHFTSTVNGCLEDSADVALLLIYFQIMDL